MTMEIVYFDTAYELVINNKGKKICAKQIPFGVVMLVSIMGPPKIKENNQNILLNVIFIQRVQCNIYICYF